MIIIFFVVYNAQNILIFWLYINCLHHCERIPEDTPGAYVSLKNELIQNIKYHVNPGTEKKKNKISGEFSRISNFVALSFSLIIIFFVVYNAQNILIFWL
jgi:hypothetical protein